MCCDLRTHVKVIAIICLIFTALGSLNLIGTVGLFISGQVTPQVNMIYGGSNTLALFIQVIVYAFWIGSEIMCLVGAIKNNKCLLIPFIICLSLTILACIGFAIFFILLGSQALDALTSIDHQFKNDEDFQNAAATFGSIFFFLMIVPLLIVLGLTIYFLVIVVKYYNEISSGVVSGQQDGMVLQPYTTSPAVQGGGVSMVYAQPGAQNISYPYQQQPATNMYAQPVQPYTYPANNPGMKNPA